MRRHPSRSDSQIKSDLNSDHFDFIPNTISKASAFLNTTLPVSKIISGDIQSVMQFHSVVSIFIGLGSLLLPHNFYSTFGYNHFAHEFIRLYGCLTLGIGYLVWRTREIKDGRLQKAVTETFALCYGLQALAMFRAQLTSPEGYSLFHWFIIILFACVSGLYTYSRFSTKIKSFELPGFERGE
mmetsp:Transcript_12996/g.12617  ORF Transcript_12996/g.12617 Transcript_12996/m.12617 type:complete len:183 (-) Transcript_12996:394-942(-)